jgi:predicted transposase YbfD/YdcC
MSRSTQEERIAANNYDAAIDCFALALAGLPDPRRRQGLRYPLHTVVVTALLAMMCGCDDAESMACWAKIHCEWLKTFLDCPHGTPSQDVYLHVLGAIDPKAFQATYRAWVDLSSLQLGIQTRHIAVDGKTSRGSASPANGVSAIHTVSAFLCERGLVLAQQQTATKSNEITAIPELLKLIDLRGSRVTIDAMGCQTEIASTIVEGGGDYLLAVKENQSTLRNEIVESFDECDDPRDRSYDEPPIPVSDIHESIEKGHGRLETRRIRVLTNLGWILSGERWTGLTYVVEIHRERTVLATRKTSVETSYAIGSGIVPCASEVAKLVRGHWGVENRLHWVLDLGFREDQARHRAGNASANLTTLRHFALALIRQDPNRKLGVANARKCAGFDLNYLIRSLLTASANSA